MLWHASACSAALLAGCASRAAQPPQAGQHLRMCAEPAIVGFDAHQMEALQRRGELEANLMSALAHPLDPPMSVEPLPQRGTKKKGQKRRSVAPAYSPFAAARAALKQDGVVRVNGVLSEPTAAAMQAEVLERRAAAYADINGGADWRDYFADVLLKSNRCDLLLPLRSRGVQLALKELLDESGPLYKVVVAVLGEQAVLYELAALVSEPGSPRQPVHPDNPHQEMTPLLTCFVALQEVSRHMGATTFLPGTHTAAAHAAFDESVAARDLMLASSASRFALLGSGDCTLFDSRTLHCGGANAAAADGGKTRALLYVSFRNPRTTLPVGNVGSIKPEVQQKSYTLRELRTRLATLTEDAPPDFDPFDDSEAEAETVRDYRAAAEKGQIEAMFNLGMCYRRGEGVAQNAAEAARWFRLAADEGLALAQTNLGFSYFLGEGVEKDEAEAARLFELAADQGEASAQHNLGVCYSQGLGVEVDFRRALELHRAAALVGHSGAKVAFEELTRISS